ncbi:MAG TPA: hypothetical protein VL979_03805 [Solirubrobacteraceae bacterium]|nr:hypothetical protein [Solirubrobacteraceae bacterium]
MAGERSRYGLLVSACGAVVLVVSVFLPWYEVSSALHAGAGAAGSVAAGTVAGAAHRTGLLSAHRALHEVNVLLLALAALAILDALAPLARRAAPLPGGAGGAVVLLGAAAAALVLYRMLAPPAAGVGVVETGLREGAWLALLGSLAIALGGMWPRSIDLLQPPVPGGAHVWSSSHS